MTVIDRLARHEGIGFDFDGTLIGNPGNKLLWKFITDHHATKTFWIVTFRANGLQHECIPILERYARLEPFREVKWNVPTADMFKGVRGVPNELWAAHADAIEQRNRRTLTGPLTQPEIDMFEFKAKTCAELGLTCLIDDMAGMVEDGCNKYGIEFIDATDLLELVGG